MSLERRLQHAARELRAVDVAVPPLGAVGPARSARRRFGLQVVAVPLLFVVGGLVVVGVLDDRRDAGDSFDDTPAVVDPAAAVSPTPDVVPASLGHPTADAERAVIDRIVSTAARPGVDAPPASLATTVPTIGFTGPL